MSFWKFILDGATEVTTPDGWENATVNIERDDTIRGLLYQYTSNVTFYGDGYTYIKNKLDTEGFCTEITCEIQTKCEETDTFDTFFDGTIFISECRFDPERCTASCQIRDQTYNAKIENFKDAVMKLGVGRSRNDDTITVPTHTNITFFNPTTGANIATDVRCFPVYDAFKSLVLFTTDGELQFDSVYFGSGGDAEGWVVTTGAAIRDALAGPGVTVPPVISFEELFEEVNKKSNIQFYIDSTTTPPTVFVEPTEDVYETGTAETLTNVANISMILDEVRLYSSIDIGSNDTQNDEGGTYEFADGQYFGHKKEQYNVLGKCNIKNKLDLVSSWVIDSNVIEDIIDNSGSDTHDDKIFLVETNLPGAATAKKYSIFSSPTNPVVYNEAFTNQNVMPRWTGSIHSNIALFLGDGDDEFEAQRTGDTAGPISELRPIAFDNEISDPNGNYDAVTQYDYLVPATGAYFFEIRLLVDNIVWISPSAGDIDVSIDLNVNGTSVETFTFTIAYNTTPTSLIQFTKTLYLDSGDAVDTGPLTIDQSVAGPPFHTFDLMATSSFACVEAVTGGGIYQTFDPEDIRILLYNFEHPLSHSDFAALLPNNRQKVNFSNADGDINVTGWIESLVYDVNEAVGRWEVSDKNVLD